MNISAWQGEGAETASLLLAMAFNLGVLMRKLFKMWTPRSLQGLQDRLVHTILLWWRLTIMARYYFMPNRGGVWYAA